jgi:hypothetical protein
MNKKVANHAQILLIVIFCFGLFQAWKESRYPFVFFKVKPQNTSIKLTTSYNNRNYAEISPNKKTNQ